MVQALSWARLLTRSHFLPLIAVHDGDGDGGIRGAMEWALAIASEAPCGSAEVLLPDD